MAEPRVVLSELTGPIVLDGQLAVFDGVRGLANGGALALDGTIAFDGMALSGGTLNIQAQGVALELPRGLRSELDALVTFRPDPESPSITGDIRIVQSAYTETITLAALARQAALPITPSNVERPIVDRMQLNLAITTTEASSWTTTTAGWPRRKRAGWHCRPSPAWTAASRCEAPGLSGGPHLPHHSRRRVVYRSPPHSSRIQHRG